MIKRCAKDRLRKQTKIEELTTLLFVFLSAAALIGAVGRAYSSRGLSIQDSLFWNTVYSDHFMDMFNSLRESRDVTWIYQRNIIYPPLSILFTYLVSLTIPWKDLHIRFAERYSMQLKAATNTSWLVIVILCLLIVALCTERYLRRKDLSRLRYVCVFFIIVDFPMIYCIERGNLSLLAMALCAFFVFFRNDDRKVVRELSYLSLALAAGLKLFPAAFGILLLYDKKYKAAARTVLYGIAALIVPYLMLLLLAPADGGIRAKVIAQHAGNTAMLGLHGTGLGGGRHTALSETLDTDGSLLRFIKNLISRSQKTREFTFDSTSSANLIYFLGKQGVFSEKSVKVVAVATFFLTELLGGILGFFSKKEWQRVFFAAFLILNVHAVAMHYTLIYLTLPLIVFLAQTADRKTRRWPDIVYTLFFSVQFIILPLYSDRMRDESRALFHFWLNVSPPMSFNKIVSCVMFQLLFLAVSGETVVHWVRERKRKRLETKDERLKMKDERLEA